MERETHVGISVLYKRVSARFAFERARLVEEVVELGDFAEFGEYLQ